MMRMPLKTSPNSYVKIRWGGRMTLNNGYHKNNNKNKAKINIKGKPGKIKL